MSTTSYYLRAWPGGWLQAEQPANRMQTRMDIPPDIVQDFVRDSESDGEINLVCVEVFYGFTQCRPICIWRHVVRCPYAPSKRSLLQLDMPTRLDVED